MPTPEESAERIADEFAAGNWKVELEPEEVKNWHEIRDLVSAMGLGHINMSETISAMIKPPMLSMLPIGNTCLSC